MIDKFLATVAAVAVAFALWCGLATLSEKGRADKAEAQVVQLQRDAQTAKTIADIRAESAKHDLDVATAAAAANRTQATTYLQLPTPAPADRCAAAQALVDEAIQKERQ